VHRKGVQEFVGVQNAGETCGQIRRRGHEAAGVWRQHFRMRGSRCLTRLHEMEINGGVKIGVTPSCAVEHITS
jgi:hypothetical protein